LVPNPSRFTVFSAPLCDPKTVVVEGLVHLIPREQLQRLCHVINRNVFIFLGRRSRGMSADCIPDTGFYACTTGTLLEGMPPAVIGLKAPIGQRGALRR